MALVTWLAYAPGLDGWFLFDDLVNLPALGAYGPVDNWTAFWRYLTSGNADLTGRPLALLSFLIDARDWPADPLPFKRSNLLLHLVNGALLLALLLQLGRIQRGRHDRVVSLSATLGAGLWLLHPLLVSTTLYIVQREAMLPASFILLGILGWTSGRERATSGRRGGVMLAGSSIIICTLLATLSKANGALLPLLTWLVDALLLAPRLPLVMAAPGERSFRRLRQLALILPSLALLSLLAAYAIQGLVQGMPPFRPWTLGERLLTEARILVEYLGLLWLPRSYSAGVFNDAITTSTGLLSPPSTLFSIFLLLALGTLAHRLRHRQPLIALALGFFFIGHLIESTVVPLELYFEHRNYIPSLFMFWPLSWWLGKAWQRAASGPVIPLRRALSIALPLLLAILTFQRASLWGNVDEQGLLWAARNPVSPRAQAWAAQIEMERGQPARALARLEAALAMHTNELQIAINAADAQCALEPLRDIDRSRIASALREDRRPGRLAHTWLSRKIGTLSSPASNCRGLDSTAISHWLDALAGNRLVELAPARQLDLLNLRGQLALADGDAAAALAWFDRAIAARAEPASALSQSVLLARAGHPEMGLQHLAYFRTLPVPSLDESGMPWIHARLLARQNYWAEEIARLEAQLRRDAADGPR